MRPLPSRQRGNGLPQLQPHGYRDTSQMKGTKRTSAGDLIRYHPKRSDIRVCIIPCCKLMKRTITLVCLLGTVFLFTGCETNSQDGFDQGGASSGKKSSSGPTDINLSGNIRIDLPEEIGDEFDIPQVTGNFVISIHAEYLDESMNRSQYSTHLELRITNLAGTKEYITIDTDSNGEYDGSPNQGVGTAFEQVMETIGIYGRLLQEKTRAGQSVDTTPVSAPR